MDTEILSILTTMGRSVTIRRMIDGDYDPSTGLASQGSDDVTATAAIVNYSDRFRLAGQVNQNDRKALIAAKGLTLMPKNGDRIVDAETRYLSDDDGNLIVDDSGRYITVAVDKAYTITDVQAVVKKDTPVAYICRCRV